MRVWPAASLIRFFRYRFLAFSLSSILLAICCYCCASSIKFIPRAIDRMDEFRFRRYAGDLFAQVLDVAIDGAIADHSLIGIYLIHELGSIVYASGIGRKEVKQFKLDHGKIQILALQRRLKTFLIQMQNGWHARLLPDGTSSQHRLDAGHDLPWAERLADVIIGAELKPQKPVDFFNAGGDHDDRHRRERADLLAYIHAVSPRQHQVQKHQDGRSFTNPRPDVKTVLQAFSLKPRLAQVIAQELGQLGLVFNDQYGVAHSRPAESDRVMRSQTPPSGEWSTSIAPSWASTILRQIARPRPAPPEDLLRDPSTRKRRSNSFLRSSSETPGPLSMMSTVAPPCAASSAMSSVPPESVYFFELSSRLSKSCANRSPSANTITGS